MSDGSTSSSSPTSRMLANWGRENEARALRVLEIMQDFRTVQTHITAQVTRAEATPPDQASYYLAGYVVLRQCNAEAQAILATHYNPGSLGLESGHVPDTEVQRATLQRYVTNGFCTDFQLILCRIILDASSRRFQAHKAYLRAAAGMRWVLLRQQVAARNLPTDQRAQAMRAVDARLEQVSVTSPIKSIMVNVMISHGCWSKILFVFWTLPILTLRIYRNYRTLLTKRL